MKKINCIFIIFICISCNTSKTNNLEIDKKFSNNLDSTAKVSLMVTPSQFEDCYLVKVDNIDYLISIDINNRIKSIFTYDTKFRSIDWIKIGMKLSEVIEKSKHKPYLINGWAYVVPLNSGWYAAFETSNYESNALSSDSTVKWIYKRQ